MKTAAAALLGTLIGLRAAGVVEAQQDPVAEARSLAKSGQRGACLELLQSYLTREPDDSDARVLYGTVLSWEGRYDEARRELQQVLDRKPHHGDALPALINVELWSDRPDRAEELAREALSREPNDTSLLLARARALHALKRDREAVTTLERLLSLDPGNPQARSLWRGIRASGRVWELKSFYENDWFNDGRTSWHEAQLSLKRRTDVGTLIGRYSRASRFSTSDSLLELDFYPGLGRGTYAFVNIGASAEKRLYPRYRLAADVYRSLGSGFEASLGYRRLGFTSTVDIYTASLGKYVGNWFLLGRYYHRPDVLGASRSYHLSVRRFFGDRGDYLDLRYGKGASKAETRTLNELEVLDSDTVHSELYRLLGAAWGLHAIVAYSREERLERKDLRQYAAAAGLFLRF